MCDAACADERRVRYGGSAGIRSSYDRSLDLFFFFKLKTFSAQMFHPPVLRPVGIFLHQRKDCNEELGVLVDQEAAAVELLSGSSGHWAAVI